MKKIIVIIGVVIIAVGMAFYGGMRYAESKRTAGAGFGMYRDLSPAERQQALGQFRLGGGQRSREPGGGGQAGELVSGEIISYDDKSVIAKVRDGGSRIIFYSDRTSIRKMIEAEAGDLAAGQEITAVGPANSDGSVTAESIQLR